MRSMNAKKGTVLLVDDDQDFLLQQKSLIESLGFETLVASGREEAEAHLKAGLPDLAILDLMMEEGDAGFVLAHRIKQMKPTLPVILVTSVTHETGLEFALEGKGDSSWIKADALLAKPVRFEQLRREVERLLP